MSWPRLASILCVISASLGAQQRDSLATQTLSPGVTWRRIVRPAGPWVLNIVTVDLRRSDLELRQVRARDSLRGREKLTSMVARTPEDAARVLAAVNTDFFSLATGESENNVVIGGEWWKGIQVTDSPFDTFDNVHAQFGVDGARRPLLGRYVLDGTAIVARVPTPVLAVNAISRTGPEGTALYTDRVGVTPTDTTRALLEVPLARVGIRADTQLFVRRGPTAKAGGNAVAPGAAVLAAYGARTAAFATVAEGDTVRVVLRARAADDGSPSRSPALLVGGWPRIVRDGVAVADRSAWVEGTISRNAEVRNPRTAVGFSRDSSTLFLVTVDGRQAASAGMTLPELADFMRELGAWQALNFDGGGSTSMVLAGKLVNSVSDPTGEREVASGLLLVKRTP